MQLFDGGEVGGGVLSAAGQVGNVDGGNRCVGFQAEAKIVEPIFLSRKSRSPQREVDKRSGVVYLRVRANPAAQRSLLKWSVYKKNVTILRKYGNILYS